MNKIKILICEDHNVTARLVSRMLSRHEQFTICGIVNNGDDVIDFVNREHIDILVLDIHIPYKDGIQVMNIILKQHPDLKIIVLSSDMNSRIVSKSMQLGASGYLSKLVSMEELTEAIEVVNNGGKYISKDVMQSLTDIHEI